MNRLKFMDINKSMYSIPAILVVVSGILFTPMKSAAAETVTRIFVMPFTISSSEDLSFLQRGIAEMLIARLGRQDQVIVTTGDLTGNDTTDSALAKKNADYVVRGNLTVLKGGVSTDARVLSGGKDGKTVLYFARTGNRQSDIINHIDEFAAEINDKILDHAPTQTSRPEVKANTKSRLAHTDTGVGNDYSIQPSPISTKPRPSDAPRNSGLLSPLRMDGLEKIKGRINGLAAGDMDGDGVADIVTVTGTNLVVHRSNAGRWIKLAEFKGTGEFVGVDSVDLNGNGRQEIFVTNFDNTEGRVASFVLEWDGKNLQRLGKVLPWYFRAMDIKGRGRVLLGQRQGRGEGFLPGIYEMVWRDQSYETGNDVTLPKNLNIFGFARGNIRSSGKMEVVAYDSNGHIQVLDPSGNKIVSSINRYGESPNAIIFIDENEWDEKKKLYLQQRIILHDYDADGIQEILAVNNEESAYTGVLAKQRSYTKGRLEWLECEERVIRTAAHSLDINDFIADTALADIDEDNDLEIVAAVVNEPGGVLSEGTSYLTAFKINSIH